MERTSALLTRDTVLSANPRVQALLARLHSENSKQEASFQRFFFQLKFTFYSIWNSQSRNLWNPYFDKHLTGQLLSHDKEKCEFIYMLACLNGSKSMIECGTSFGISTMYMALACQRNAPCPGNDAFGVLTMEKDPAKLVEAKKIWKEAGKEVEDWIEPREGDLLELLKDRERLPPVVDLLFLDAWTSLALPALKLVLPNLRDGSLVFADKTSTAKVLYADLLDFVHNPENGFMSMTIPFSQGFEVMIYKPDELKKKLNDVDLEAC